MSTPPPTEAQAILDSIRRIVKSLREASKQAEKEAGLSAAQLFVLQKIAESEIPLNVNDLAARTLTHQSSVSVVLAKLVRKNLVQRDRSKKDARIVEFRLSKKGQGLIRTGSPLIQDRLLIGISRLTEAERRSLDEGLRSWVRKAGLQDEEPTLFFEESLPRKKHGRS